MEEKKITITDLDNKAREVVQKLIGLTLIEAKLVLSKAENIAENGSMVTSSEKSTGYQDLDYLKEIKP